MSSFAIWRTASQQLLQFAARNLLRNKRRTSVTAFSIAVGFAALALFAGYTMNVYIGMSMQAMYGEMLGHITIAKRGMALEGRMHPEKYLFTAKEIAAISDGVKQVQDKASFAPRLAVNGLVSNGKVSTIFFAEGIAPQDMAALRGPRAFPGSVLEADKAGSVMVANGLMSMLGLKEGADMSLLGSTLTGQANALDAQVLYSFDTGSTATNDKLLFIPLEMARSLYDAAGRADRLTVVLPQDTPLEETRNRIVAKLAPLGLDLEVQTWQELSMFFSRVKGMYDMIFAFMFVIVLVISVMALVNVIGMNVIERTREIGSLRALGMRRNGVVRVFVLEAALMVLLGCAMGMLLTLALRFGINAADISYIPPASTDKVPLSIGLNLPMVAGIALILMILGAFAAWLTATRAVRQPIIVALGHV